MGGSVRRGGEAMSAPQRTGHFPADALDDVSRVGLPVNLDAERFLLAAAMRDADDLGRIIGIIQPEDFSKEPHRVIARAQRELHERGETVDMLSVASHLRDARKLESVDGMSFIASL